MQETKKPSDYLRSHLPQYLQDLKNLVKIPSVSFEGFPEAPLRECAGAVAEIFKKRGLEKVEILEVSGVRGYPYVYAEWCKAPGAPTVLLYAHYDVQPAGRTEVWNTPPFEATEKEGPGGLRLYGRGSADDKAGLMVHIASCRVLAQDSRRTSLQCENRHRRRRRSWKRELASLPQAVPRSTRCGCDGSCRLHQF
jgi:acetylornithine deacetylase/succinyl-diaminopimelate desuccinylase-like protein